MANPQKYGNLWIQTPVFNTGAGDFALVDDPTQSNFPLGGIYAQPDSSNRPRMWKYVEWNPSSTPTYVQGGPVYYTDETRTIVSSLVADAATNASNKPEALFSFAGIILNPTIPTAGHFVYIQTGGFCDKIKMPASTAVSDILVLSNGTASAPTNNVWVRIAAGADLTLLKAGLAVVFVTTIVSGGGAGLGHGWIQDSTDAVSHWR